jgi:carbonic anhydrase
MICWPTTPRTRSFAEGDLGSAPARRVAVVACMDARPSQRLLGTEEIVLIHHTECGMQSFRDDEFRASIERDTGIRPPWAAEAFSDLDQDLAAVDGAGERLTVRPAQGLGARFRLRGRRRAAARGLLIPPRNGGRRP